MIGETLGGYTIVGRIGAGGMGEVYLAEHTRIERRAAIKVLLPELSGNHEVVERFFAEARATSSIRHRGIVEVLDCAVHSSGRAYIVMELLEGESLAARLEREPTFGRDLDRTLTVAGAVADAVAAAHAKGIVHRDLKPDNIFLAYDADAPLGFAVKILDFGIAKLIGDGSGSGRGASMRTRTGSLLGTPAYMSPEQCRGAGLVDHRTDIYSLGCIVFEMLAGRRPFLFEGFGELISAHLHQTPPTFASLGVDVPPNLEQWVERLLAKSPGDRFASMTDVSAAVHSLRHRSTAVLPSQPGGTLPAPTGTAVMPAVGALPTAPTSRTPAPSPRTPAPGGTVMLPTPVRAGTTPPALTTLSAHASESVGRVSSPMGKWAAGAIAVLALIGIAVFALRPRPMPAAPSTPAAEPAPAPTTVVVEVSDAPAGLTVTIDGAPASLPIHLPAGPDTHALLFRAPGFRERTLSIDGLANRTLTLALQAVAPAVPVAPTTEPEPGAPAADAHKRRPHHSPSGGGLSDEARKL
ncbi:MAG TPA: protein kinase [Polyangia bacterium]|jgi:serine/threonine-protein kinase